MTESDYAILLHVLSSSTSYALLDHNGYDETQLGGIRLVSELLGEVLSQVDTKFDKNVFVDTIAKRLEDYYTR